MVQKPDAPVSAVMEIVKTFRGVATRGMPPGWRVMFNDSSDEQNATTLINMLQGWEAVSHPNVRNTIRIRQAS